MGRMQVNRVKQGLAAGGVSLGSMIFEFFTPAMPRLLKNAGAEYALSCMEHPGAGFEGFRGGYGGASIGRPSGVCSTVSGLIPSALSTVAAMSAGVTGRSAT